MSQDHSSCGQQADNYKGKEHVGKAEESGAGDDEAPVAGGVGEVLGRVPLSRIMLLSSLRFGSFLFFPEIRRSYLR